MENMSERQIKPLADWLLGDSFKLHMKTEWVSLKMFLYYSVTCSRAWVRTATTVWRAPRRRVCIEAGPTARTQWRVSYMLTSLSSQTLSMLPAKQQSVSCCLITERFFPVFYFGTVSIVKNSMLMCYHVFDFVLSEPSHLGGQGA